MDDIKVIANYSDIVAIANAVRGRTGGSEEMTLSGIVGGINEISISGGTDTSDATAVANDIMLDKTAYTAEGKVTGTFTIDDELTEQNDLISQISAALEGKSAGGGTTKNTVTVTVRNQSSNPVTYFDVNKTSQTVAALSTQTVEALNGVLYYMESSSTSCSGDYVLYRTSAYRTVIFLSDGGTMNCGSSGGDA